MARGDAERIRNYYRVPAKLGMEIVVAGNPYRIVGFRGMHLRCRFLGEPVLGVFSVHPTWSVTYPTT